MSMIEFMGFNMTEACAKIAQCTIDGMTYAQTAEKLKLDRVYVKCVVNRLRHRGINIPPVARSEHRKVTQKLAASTQRIISLAKAGMSNEEIALEVGSTAHKISNMLSYHRRKGEDLPIYTLPIDEYEALHKQGLSQQRIAKELGIGKMKASSCARSLIAQGRIEGNNRREKRNDSPIGGDKWALVLGRKSLY